METTYIITEIKGNTLIIKLNRPEVLNAMNLEMRKEILSVLKEYENNNDIKCVIFTGTGKAFSAGADLNYLLSLNSESEIKEYVDFVHSLLNYIRNYPKPTVGAVNGTAVGGGLELLLTLDIVIASKNAKFGQTEINVGLIPGGGGTQRLPRLVGIRKAKELIFLGELISADEALRLNLINKVVEDDKVLDEALNICNKLSTKDLELIKRAKELINLSFENTEGLQREAKYYIEVLKREESKETIRAFLNKRK